MSEYISVKEAAEKWGVAESTVRKWCREGKIYSVKKAEQDRKGTPWRIPADAECPKGKKG